MHNPVVVLETKDGDQARERGPRADALISLCYAHAVFTDRSPGEYFMKVLKFQTFSNWFMIVLMGCVELHGIFLLSPKARKYAQYVDPSAVTPSPLHLNIVTCNPTPRVRRSPVCLLQKLQLA